MSDTKEALLIYRVTNSWFDDPFYEDHARIRYVENMKSLPFDNRIVIGKDKYGRRCEEYYDCREQLIIGHYLDN